MWPVCSRLLKYWDFEQAQKKPTLRWGGFLYNRFDVKKERRKQGFPKTLIRVRSKLMGYQLALMFNQVEIGYQQPALLRLFKFPHWAIIHLHSDCIARRRVAVWSGGNLCVTKSHLISCRRPTRPMPTAYTRTYTRIRIRIHLRTHANTHVYTPVKCAPPPPPTKAHILLADAPGGCMSVCECIAVFLRTFVYLYTHLRSYKNLGIPPHPPQ